MIKIINFRFYFSFFFLLFDLYSQYGRGGWFHGYSFTCQPVDYSLDEMAVRVSFKIKAGEIIKRRTKFKWAKANEKTLKKKNIELNWTKRNWTKLNEFLFFIFFERRMKRKLTQWKITSDNANAEEWWNNELNSDWNNPVLSLTLSRLHPSPPFNKTIWLWGPDIYVAICYLSANAIYWSTVNETEPCRYAYIFDASILYIKQNERKKRKKKKEMLVTNRCINGRALLI